VESRSVQVVGPRLAGWVSDWLVVQ
jgi:hypothetical protein